MEHFVEEYMNVGGWFAELGGGRKN